MKKRIFINANIDKPRIKRIFFFLKENRKFKVLYNPFESAILIKKGEKIFEDYKFLLFLFKIIIRLLSDICFLLISSVSNYCFFSVSKLETIKLAKILKKKIIYDFYISKYDTKILDRKEYTKNSIKAKIMKKYDKNVLESSNLVLFVTEAEAEYYCKLTGISKSKINYKILPLSTEKKPRANLDYYYNKHEVFNMCWWGTYIALHGLDIIINTMEILKKNYNFNFKLFILGNSVEESIKYKKMVNQKNLNDVIIIRNDLTFANKRLERFLKLNCDLALGAFGNSKKAKIVMTNKVVEACSMKIPILTGYSTGMEEYFCSDKNIYFCMNNKYKMAEKIIYISAHKEESLKRAKNNYIIYKNNFSFKHLKNNLNKIFI